MKGMKEMKEMKGMKVKKVEDVYKESRSLQETILFSRKKVEITRAFDRLKCLISGRCICDLCPEWDRDTYIVYEFGRCIVPTRFLQLVKELHAKSKRWAYIQPLYRDLYAALHEDLLPDTGVMSNGDMENIRCGFTMSRDTLQAASKELEKIQKIDQANTKRMRKMQCAMYNKQS